MLRKSGRMSNEDPDDLVWSKLTRTTLDGIEVAPIASPADAASVTTEGRPVRTGDWDVRAHFIGPDAAAANEAALVDLDGGVSSLWLELGQGLEVAALGEAARRRAADLAPGGA